MTNLNMLLPKKPTETGSRVPTSLEHRSHFLGRNVFFLRIPIGCFKSVNLWIENVFMRQNVAGGIPDSRVDAKSSRRYISCLSSHRKILNFILKQTLLKEKKKKLLNYSHVTTVHDTVTKLYSCVIEIKMKAEFEDSYGPSKSAGCRGVESGKGPCPPPLARQ